MNNLDLHYNIIIFDYTLKHDGFNLFNTISEFQNFRNYFLFNITIWIFLIFNILFNVYSS